MEAKKKKKPLPKPKPTPEAPAQGPGGSLEFHGDAGDLDHLLPTLHCHSAWSSPEKYASYIESLDKDSAWQKAGWTHDGDFTGTKDMEEAIAMARYGWKEGAEKIEKLRGMISAMYPRSLRPVAYGLAGSTPDVPAQSLAICLTCGLRTAPSLVRNL